MTENSQPKRQVYRFGRLNGTQARCAGVFSLIATLLFSWTALAGWNSKPEVIAGHPTWIYTPNTTLKSSDKRGLMIVLHGCVQTHDQIKNGGNLETAAEQNGLILAVPYVTPEDGWPYANSTYACWGYDGQLADTQGHVREITDLARALQSKFAPDPRHIYVIGLSSGGALALKAGCAAPDVFAGIGAIAGPSVGSNQGIATQDRAVIPATNVDDAIDVCKDLAGDKLADLQKKQVANIAHGDMDRNGPKTPPCYTDRPGQNCVASIKWSEDNVAILRQLYGASELGAAAPIQGGKATERTSEVGGKPVLSYLILHDVGHAFPAGSGKPNDATYGQYIAQQGVNYSEYVAEWLVQNNRHVNGDGPACITADNSTHVTQGRATACGFFGFWACAKGSGDDLGLNFSYFSSSVQETQPQYWAKVDRCP